MILGEVLGAEVIDPAGTVAGRVADARLVRGSGVDSRRLFLHGLLVSRRHPIRLFGYERHDEEGPWVLRTTIRWLRRHDRYAEWRRVRFHDGRIYLDSPLDDLPHPGELS